MIKGLYTAYTGMVNEQKRLDVQMQTQMAIKKKGQHLRRLRMNWQLR